MTVSTKEHVTFAEYRALPGVNWSSLKHMRKSPLHYKHALEHPKEATDAMRLGNAVHTAVFEPDKFDAEYAIWPGRRAGKEWETFADENAKRTILKSDQADHCHAIADAVRANPIAAALLTGRYSEEAIQWEDGETMLQCKARIDHVSASIVDLKTTSDAGPFAFGRTIAQMSYHCQMAFYREGWSHRVGTMCPVYFIVVEQEPPHDVVVYELAEEALQLGWQECQKLLASVRDCRKVNQWPGRFGLPQKIDLPAWVYGPADESKVPAIMVGEEEIS